jgi:type IX secretion system PorP/SprF family membrane protein
LTESFDILEMFRRYLVITTLLLLTGLILEGQSGPETTRISLPYPVYSQYLHNGLLINPAYAGARDVLSFFLSGRLQWAGIKGAPTSETVSIHSLLKNDRVGLGLTGQFFKYGFSKTTSVYTDYAYHVRLGKGKLAFGLKAGFDMSNTDYSAISLIDKPDLVFQTNDKPYFMPNAGAGLYFYGKKFFAGAAVPSFLSYIKNRDGNVSFNAFKDYDIYASAGALITIAPAFKFKPSVFIDYSVQQTKKMQLDLNGNFIIYDFIWIGGSWRTSEQVAVGILQLQVNPQIMVGYSYDYPVGRMNTYSKGSHEIVLRYEFSYKVSAANPRYF